jgi:hypothetical protein
MEKLTVEEIPQDISAEENVINQLDKLLDTHSKESKFEDIESKRKHFSSIDTRVESVSTEYEKTLGRILERYGCDVQVEKIGNGLFRIPIPHEYIIKKLPEGYGYMGGGARSALLRTLGIDELATTRDIDIVRVLDTDILGLDSELAETYSAEDYAHGHGVQELQQDYFKTRDFTINEVLVYGDWIYATKNCLLDTARRVLRFTEYEQRNDDEYGDMGISQKLLAKAVRLASEEVVRGKKFEIKNKEAYQFTNISPFFIALHLDRAFSRGNDVATEYVRQLVSLKQLPDSITNPIQAVDYLLEAMDNPYIFQHAPESIIETDEEIDEMYEKFGHLIDKWEK